MNSILLYIGVILIVGILGYLGYELSLMIKARDVNEVDKITMYKGIGIVGGLSISFPILMEGIALLNAYPMNATDHVLVIVFGLLFGLGLSTFIISFVMFYYKPDFDQKLRKYFRIAMFSAIPFMVFGFSYMLEGIAPYMSYPLINSIIFTGEGIIFGTANSSPEGFTIAFYGVIILIGAVIAYLIGDHKFYKKFGKHGIIDSMFLIAFPAGIVGARLWYCLVLEPDIYFKDPARIFEVWDGGLAIMGGAILGIIAGVAFMMTFRKYVSVRWAIDMIVPGILIAQAIGRWGNFLNHEVFGALQDATTGLNTVAVSMSDWWFLPTWITNQMAVGFSNGSPTSDMMYIPLFLIECVTNIAGYYIIVYGIGKPLKKWLPEASLGCLYISWYGLTRVVLEPMRYNGAGFSSADNFEYAASLYTAWGMVAAGLVGIGLLWLYDKYFPKKKVEAIESDSVEVNIEE